MNEAEFPVAGINVQERKEEALSTSRKHKMELEDPKLVFNTTRCITPNIANP